MDKTQQTYRNLLKEAYQNKKLGPYRIGVPAAAGLGIGGYGIYEFNTAILLMSLFLIYIAFLHYKNYKLAKNVLKSLEYLVASWQNANPPDVEELQ